MSAISRKTANQGCQLCKDKPTDFLVDGKTKHGYWAFMCVNCHAQVGYGLGTGRGQKYSIKTLQKVEG